MARLLLALVLVAYVQQATPRPVKKTLNFNMFVLRPKQDQPDRLFIATDGLNRFGPVLEYIVQRMQGMMSVKLPQNHNKIDYYIETTESSKPSNADKLETDKPDAIKPILDDENEVDGLQENTVPGVVVRPSSTKPGTYEVEIAVVVDDGQPDSQADEKKQ